MNEKWQWKPEEYDDLGSSLGKFWFKLFKGNILLSNIATRGTIAWMVNLSLISIPILKENWISYLIGCWFIKLAYVTCSWRDLGGFWFKGKYLLWGDFITYGMVGLVSSIIIFY